MRDMPTSATQTPPPVNGLIVDQDLPTEMRTSFLEYAYSVIYARALPDARDGLKPVQRRILFQMDRMGLRPDRPHVKCSRVVGDVMGRLHPHGDVAIYEALVRLAQPFTMRLPLVDGHGNFGSLDDGPAAARYTEARLAASALALTADIDEDTVDFSANYDYTLTEPGVLPASLPNLLVNGASGIAVGMATNMPPHNLVEVIGAARHLIDHPEADLEDLMAFVPGPDLPAGGMIVGLDGIREAYRTGRGKFLTRATARIENLTPRKKGIVVTELPYLVGPEKIITRIKEAVASKKLQGITDVADLTDRKNGTRLVIGVKNGYNPEAVLTQLYRHTPLEDSFGINNVALVDGQPRTLGLKELLQVYLDHRLDVCLRRARFQLDRAQERLHLVEGLLLAMIDIDDVIAIIRSSEDAGQARERLIAAFELDEIQANHILDMQLRRLTRLSRIELETERDELRRRIEELTGIIEDPQRLHRVVSDRLTEVARRYGTPRRTVLLEDSGAALPAAAEPLEIPDGPCWVMLGSAGLVARMNRPEGAAHPDALPASGPRGRHDVIVSAIATSTHAEFGVVTTAGRLVRARVIDLPETVQTANAPSLRGGARLTELVALERDERPLALTTLDPDGPGLAVGTRAGVVKRVNPEVLTRDAWEIIRLDDGDELVGALQLVDEDDDLVFVTSDAQLLHFPASLVRPQGRGGGGVAGIRLGEDAQALWFGASPTSGAVVVTVSGSSEALPGTEAGSVKLTDFAEYPAKGRATAGVRCHRFLKGEDALTLAWVGPAPAVAAAASGSAVDLPPATGKRDGSGTPLVRPVAAVSSRVMPH